MTLDQIISTAIEQKGMTNNPQNIAHWADKFTQIANEGLVDLATDLQLRRTDVIDIGDDGILDIKSDMPYECLKVIRITQNGREIPFGRGPSTFEIKVAASGEAEVEYRYLPNAMTSGTDEPGIPERLHNLLVLYICGRDLTTKDLQTQSEAEQYYQLYRRQKAAAKKTYGEPETYTIYHKFGR